MCEAVGHPVRRLVRVRIGSLSDRRLSPGQWRELTQHELRALERSVAPPPARGDRSRGRDGRRPTSRPGSDRR